MAEAILQFGTQMSTNLMNMAEQHRLDAMHREELLRQEAAEKDKIASIRERELQERAEKREQMLKQEKMELAEQNARREEKLLENEFKRQKLQTEMQLEIERRRNAAETNNLMAQTEMFERREIEYIARKDREAEIEREKLQTFYEQRIAFEKKYYEEKEKRMKHEAQLREQNLSLEKKNSWCLCQLVASHCPRLLSQWYLLLK